MTKLDDDQRTEFKKALKATEGRPLIEPSADEARNGWTAETLTAYVAEQDAAASLRTDPVSAQNRAARRPTKALSRYSPFRWRRR
jgi:hypothetical protein